MIESMKPSGSSERQVPATPVSNNLNYLEHLQRESRRFRAVLAGAPEGARVPTCPEWTAEDLLWHLAEVQWFWTQVVSTKASDPSGIEDPQRPEGKQALVEFFDRASEELHTLLVKTDPNSPAWNWSRAEQNAGFTRRRQAHEALIHRVDAELTVQARTTIDPALAADGVDEVLTIVHGYVPVWATTNLHQESGTVRITANDTGDTWLCGLGRFTGTNPNSGAVQDGRALQVLADDGAAAAASLSGTAADLDCLLWNRPVTGEIVREGDEVALARLEEFITTGLQ